MFGVQTPFDTTETDSTNSDPSLLKRNNMYRFSDEHPRTITNFKYRSDKLFDITDVDTSGTTASNRLFLDSFLLTHPFEMDIDDYI